MIYIEIVHFIKGGNMTKHRNHKRKNYPSHHHIIPKSRGGNGTSENITIINSVAHEKYHNLFGNMTPDEIVKYLVDYFWKGETKWVKIYLNEEGEDE